MSCIDENTAIALIGGRLDRDHIDDIHEHAAECVGCRRLLAELAAQSTLDPDEPGLASNVSTINKLPSASPRGDNSAFIGAGTKIGKYRIIAKLGEGGLGVVFTAEDPALDRRVAIKLLRGGVAADSSRLLREARAMAKLRHPNVVAVYEVGQHGDDPFVVMELVEGVTLRQWLNEERSLRSKLDVLEQAGRGLAAAHAEGLIHRDFKPENVMVGRDGRAQVLDFGLAKELGSEHLVVSAMDGDEKIDVTQSDVLIGTPAYMAPEQFALGSTDQRTDQFAFCVVAFETIHGSRPFRGKTVREIAAAVQQGEVEREPRNFELPQQATDAIERGLSVDSGRRFPNMTALLAAIRPPQQRPRKNALAIAVGVLVVGVLLAALAASKRASNSTDAGDAIVASSELPEVVLEPIPGDPLKATVHRLRNGLTVYVSPNRKKPTISWNLVVRAGSRDNPVGAAGVSRMLAQLSFTGTARLGTVDFEAESVHLQRISSLYRQLAHTSIADDRESLLQRIDSETVAASRYALPDEMRKTAHQLGVQRISAGPTRDLTTFKADVPSNRFAEWSELASEQFVRPVFRNFHPAVGVLLSERRVRDSRDGWQRNLADTLVAELFPGHPYEASPDGSYEEILAEPFSSIEDFRRSWYAPNNAAIVLVGDVDAETALPILERTFGQWQPKRLPERRPGELVHLTNLGERMLGSNGARLVAVAWRLPPNADSNAVDAFSRVLNAQARHRITKGTKSVAMLSSRVVAMTDAAMLILLAHPKPGVDHDSVVAFIDERVSSIESGRFDQSLLVATTENARVERDLGLENNELRRLTLIESFQLREQWRGTVARLLRPPADKQAVVDVAAGLRADERAVLRIEPIAQAGVEPVEHESSKLEPASGTSVFAASILERDVVANPMRLAWRGRDYALEDTRQGPVITVPNSENNLYELSLRWELGSDQIPVICDALEGLAMAGTSELTGTARIRRWYERAMDVSVECDERAIEAHVQGIDRHAASGTKELLSWLSGAGLTSTVWNSYVETTIAHRRQLGLKGAEVAAAHYLLTGSKNRYLGRLPAATLARVHVDDARAALRQLGGTKRATLFFGRGDADRVSGGAAAKQIVRRKPRLHRAQKRAPIALFDAAKGVSAEVYVTFSLGPLPEQSIPVAQLFNTIVRSRATEIQLEHEHFSTSLQFDLRLPRHLGDAALFTVLFSAAPDQISDGLALALKLLRKLPSGGELEAARALVTERYRSDWIGPRELADIVYGWRLRGLEGDPRPERLTRIGQISEADLTEFRAHVTRAPTAIGIAGDLTDLQEKPLQQFGDVVHLGFSDIFDY